MKRFTGIILTAIAITALCSCGEDRSQEYYELTKENHWVMDQMKEVYLWRESISDAKQQTYFNTVSQFFKKLLNGGDNASWVADSANVATYGMTYSLMRDPLRIVPSQTYALVEFVEPQSVAAAAGIKRGMWLTAVNGEALQMNNNVLAAGSAVELSTSKMVYNAETEKYCWEESAAILLPAATSIAKAAVAVEKTIDCGSTKVGYILFNNFDDENAADAVCSAISNFESQGTEHIVLDLRYADGSSIANSATVAAAFVSADKAGTPFATLYKDPLYSEKVDVTFPQATVTGEKNLYIITTGRTKGITSCFVNAIVASRTNVTIVGTVAAGSELLTESFASPYKFIINPATAFIYTPLGEPANALTPHYELQEYDGYTAIYELGNEQEYMLQNICHLINNGQLPQ